MVGNMKVNRSIKGWGDEKFTVKIVNNIKKFFEIDKGGWTQTMESGKGEWKGNE